MAATRNTIGPLAAGRASAWYGMRSVTGHARGGVSDIVFVLLPPSALVSRRQDRQQILRPRFRAPADLVRWMGAVQAQDYLGSLWAVGLRLSSATESDVEAAIAARAIVRTWPMRGTLHFVPAADVRWMLGLLTPRMFARAAGRYRQLELDDAAFRRSRQILVRALEGGRQLTRPDAYAALAEGGVSPEGQRGIHIIGHLAQQAVLCFGPRQGRQPTFVLLDEWVPAGASPSREEALATLARRYFDSHGPATRHDFAWWSGLPVKDAQVAIAAAGAALVTTRDGIEAASAKAVRPSSRTAALLPTWDEYIVAYKERGAVDHERGRANPLATVGRSLLLVDGRVRGAWRRVLAGTTVQVSVEAWTKISAEERRLVEKAAQRYGAFLGKDVRLDFAPARH
jgi:hypothetical protein